MAKVNNGYQRATNLVVKKVESTTVYSLLDAFTGVEVVKYGFLYNWWATQDVGSSYYPANANVWDETNNATTVNILGENEIPFNVYSGEIELTLNEMAESYAELGEYEYMIFSLDGYHFITVKTSEGEIVNTKPNGYITLNRLAGHSIIPAAMAAEGWAVPSQTNMNTLSTYLGGASVAGGKVKETGTTYWNSPNTGATNEVGFNARGGGARGNYEMEFSTIKLQSNIWSKTEATSTTGISRVLQIKTTDFNSFDELKTWAFSLRPFRTATAAEQLLDDGLIAATYTGNDGKVYRCTKIGTQVWIADNLAETKWSDGSWIKGYDGGTYTAISNAAWAALTEAALCAYDDDEDNVMMQSTYTAITAQQLAELSEADFNQRVADFKLYVNEQEGFNVFAYETNEERSENTTVCPLPTGCIFVSISFIGGDEITGRVDIKLSSNDSLIHRENITSTDNPAERNIEELLLVNHYAYIALGLLSEGSLVSSQISWSFDNVNFTTGDTTTDILPATPCATLYILIEAI